MSFSICQSMPAGPALTSGAFRPDIAASWSSDRPATSCGWGSGSDIFGHGVMKSPPGPN
ncbi:MAG: hypothetical protein HZA50_06405 [Planctomycetes bacterium]|nr:hypothetical protein [Planctomycetota bacterium]